MIEDNYMENMIEVFEKECENISSIINSQKEIEKIIKQYKKLKKAERSNLSHIKKLGDG